MSSALPNHWLAQDGSIHSKQGLNGFHGGEIWSADDRILALSSQATGGLTGLIFHGGQPQSANAYLMNSQDGAVLLDLEIEWDNHVEVIRHRFQRATIQPYGWLKIFNWQGLEIHSRLCAFRSSIIWEVHCINRFDQPIRVAPILRLNRSSLNFNVNGQRTWSESTRKQNSFTLIAHDQLQTSDWIDVPGFKDYWIDEDTVVHITSVPAGKHGQDTNLKLAAESINPGNKSQSYYFLIVCGRTKEEVRKRVQRLCENPERPFEAQTRKYIYRANTHPTLAISGFQIAKTTYDLAPIYTEAMKVSKTGAIRSSAGGYYFVWGWDNLIGGHELTHWGDFEGARKLLQFIASHRAEDGSIPHRFDNDLQPLQVTGFDFISQLFISINIPVLCRVTRSTHAAPILSGCQGNLRGLKLEDRTQRLLQVNRDVSRCTP